MPEPIVFTRHVLKQGDPCAALSIQTWQLRRVFKPSNTSQVGDYLWAKSVGMTLPDEETLYARFGTPLGAFDVSNVSARVNPLNTPEWANCVIWLRYPNVRPQTPE